jgi:hypothetical protein
MITSDTIVLADNKRYTWHLVIIAGQLYIRAQDDTILTL